MCRNTLNWQIVIKTQESILKSLYLPTSKKHNIMYGYKKKRYGPNKDKTDPFYVLKGTVYWLTLAHSQVNAWLSEG